MLRPVLGISLALLNRFSNKYLELSMHVGAHGGSGLASCLADPLGKT